MDKKKLKKMQQRANKASSGYLKKDRLNHQIEIVEGEIGRNKRIVLGSIPALLGLSLYLDLGIDKKWIIVAVGIYAIICVFAVITSTKTLRNKIQNFRDKAEEDGIDLSS